MSHQRFALVRRPAQRSSPPVGERGMLAAVLGATALLMFGSLTLVAASLTFQSASSTGSDGEQAVDAAEWGFNSIIEKLNTDPYRHLLVTNWANGNWDTGAGNARAGCGISMAAPVGTADIRSGFQDVGSLQVSYTLTNFVPPQYPGAAPPRCTTFGNLSGGTARLEVKGEVKRGGEVIATHTLVRDVTVEALQDPSASMPRSSPLGFMSISGGYSSNINVKSTSRFSQDANGDWQRNGGEDTLSIYCLGRSVADCKSGSSALNDLPSTNSILTYSTTDFRSLYSDSPPIPANFSNVAPGTITDNADNTSATARRTSWRNFPYRHDTVNSIDSSNLKTYCATGQLALQASGAKQSIIFCRVNNFSFTGNRVVDTSRNPGIPIVLYLSGDDYKLLKGGSSPARLINKEFSVKKSEAGGSTKWNLLRIYSDPLSSNNKHSYSVPASPITDSHACSESQKLLLESGSTIDGAFIWLPRGNLQFNKTDGPLYASTSRYSLFGAAWVCKFEMLEDAVLLTNPSSTLSAGLDSIFGLTPSSPFKYRTRGVERSEGN